MLQHKRASMRRAWTLVLAVLVLAGLLSACGKQNNAGGQASGDQASPSPTAGQDKVVATYKGGQMTQAEFDKYQAFMEVSDSQTAMYLQIPQFKEQFVKQYALYRVMAARASDKQKQDADKDVAKFETQINDAMKQTPALKDQLKQKNLTVDEMKAIVKVLATANKIVTAKQDELKATVKDADIKAVFDKAPSDYNIVSVRHILIGTVDPQTRKAKRTDADALKIAQDVKGKLDKGGDWKALAKQYSEDGGSKDNGGLYEKQQASQWDPAFKKAANTQPIGQVGAPVKSQFGYHVMKVESRQTFTYDKLPQAKKDEIRQTLVNNKVQTYLQDEEKNLDIKVTLPVQPTPAPTASGAPAASSSGTPAASASPSPAASASPSASASK